MQGGILTFVRMTGAGMVLSTISWATMNNATSTRMALKCWPLHGFGR